MWKRFRALPDIAQAAAIAAVIIVLVIIGASSSGGGGKSVSATTTEATSTAPAPTLTPAQRAAAKKRAAAAAKRRAAAARLRARRAAAARARAAKRARAREIAQEKAAEAADAAANRWHRGYTVYNGDDRIAYRWLSSSEVSCQDFALDGCWQIKLITREGCSYLEVTANEMKGGTIVGSLLDNKTNIPAKTPVLMELDADTSDSVEASPPQLVCH